MFYTSDDYPFVERRSDGRVTTFAAPSDHGNSLAAKVGQLVGELAAPSIVKPATDEDKRSRYRVRRQLKLFEGFPKGLRLRPGMRYQEAAAAESHGARRRTPTRTDGLVTLTGTPVSPTSVI